MDQTVDIWYKQLYKLVDQDHPMLTLILLIWWWEYQEVLRSHGICSSSDYGWGGAYASACCDLRKPPLTDGSAGHDAYSGQRSSYYIVSKYSKKYMVQRLGKQRR